MRVLTTSILIFITASLVQQAFAQYPVEEFLQPVDDLGASSSNPLGQDEEEKEEVVSEGCLPELPPGLRNGWCGINGIPNDTTPTAMDPSDPLSELDNLWFVPDLAQ